LSHARRKTDIRPIPTSGVASRRSSRIEHDVATRMRGAHMKALITGVAGFIGSHLAESCLDRGWAVVGVDSMTTYYSPTAKVRDAECDRPVLLVPSASERCLRRTCLARR
jgi:GDP-mannose 4,6 dehydratase